MVVKKTELDSVLTYCVLKNCYHFSLLCGQHLLLEVYQYLKGFAVVPSVLLAAALF